MELKKELPENGLLIVCNPPPLYTNTPSRYVNCFMCEETLVVGMLVEAVVQDKRPDWPIVHMCSKCALVAYEQNRIQSDEPARVLSLADQDIVVSTEVSDFKERLISKIKH